MLPGAVFAPAQNCPEPGGDLATMQRALGHPDQYGRQQGEARHCSKGATDEEDTSEGLLGSARRGKMFRHLGNSLTALIPDTDCRAASVLSLWDLHVPAVGGA